MIANEATIGHPIRTCSSTINSNNNSNSRDQFVEALQLLPMKDRVDAIEALERVPHLVEIESNPDKFLERESNDINASARRFALYWKWRRELFEDRAFLLMSTIDGTGAMCEEDVRALRRGYYIPLPYFSDGRSVTFTDHYRIKRLPTAIRKRLIFYNLQVMSENAESVQRGFISHNIFSKEILFGRETKGVAMDLMNSFPVVLYQTHMFCDMDKAAADSFFATFAANTAGLLGTDGFKKVFLHTAFSTNEFKAIMHSLGFSEDCFPPRLGGTFVFQTPSLSMDGVAATTIQEDEKLPPQDQNNSANNRNTMQHFSTTTTDFFEQNNSQQRQQQQILEQYVPYVQNISNYNMPLTFDRQVSLNSATTTTTSRIPRRIENFTAVPPNAPIANYDAVRHRMGEPTFQPIGNHTSGFSGAAAPRHSAFEQQQSFLHNNSSGYIPNLVFSPEEFLRLSPSTARPTWLDHNSFPEMTPLASMTEPATTVATTSTSTVAQDHPNTFIDDYSRWGHTVPPTIMENDALVQTARMAVNEALFRLPMPYTAAYLEALHFSPGLLESESDSMRFVRTEHYNTRAAAKRLAKYWTVRKELFGEKAFLPMSQSGFGALSKEDGVALSCGEVAVLPNDSHGRSVIASDRTRVLGRVDDKQLARLRSIFYLLSAASEREINQKDGVVWLDVLISPRITEVSLTEAENTLRVMNAMPCRIKALHVIMCPPKNGKPRSAELSLAMKTMEAGFDSKRVHVHMGRSAGEIVTKLEPFGLSADQLPPIMGGSWKYEDFAKWQRKRAQSEAASARLSRGLIMGGVEGGTDGGMRGETWEGVTPSSTTNALDKKERKRMLNVIHSRQKRERRRTEAGSLEQECKELDEQNKQLKWDNRRLEELLANAHLVVVNLSSE